MHRQGPTIFNWRWKVVCEAGVWSRTVYATLLEQPPLWDGSYCFWKVPVYPVDRGFMPSQLVELVNMHVTNYMHNGTTCATRDQLISSLWISAVSTWKLLLNVHTMITLAYGNPSIHHEYFCTHTHRRHAVTTSINVSPVVYNLLCNLCSEVITIRAQTLLLFVISVYPRIL